MGDLIIGDRTAVRSSSGHPRPRHPRSPVYVLSLVGGVLVAAGGWAAATLFEHTLLASSEDVADLMAVLPRWLELAPETVAKSAGAAGLVGTHVWLLRRRTYRRIALVDSAILMGFALSYISGLLLLAVQRPSLRAIYDDAAVESVRALPTTPVTAAAVACVVMARPWVPLRVRPIVYIAMGAWVLAGLTIAESPPYLGLGLDIGVGMVAGSVVALVLGTPDLRPTESALQAGLASSGIQIVSAQRASVDARGSEPWLGRTVDGQPVFIKALSADQRAADILFRGMRWIRLRRSGDAPPEASLQRAAEHEAMVAHHARALGVTTPKVLGVARVGDKKIALIYEGMNGRSVDRLPPEQVTEKAIFDVWRQILLLRTHGIAHRDLRLANVFITDDSDAVLIDFGFGELAAGNQLLDTDVAEFLAATSGLVGSRRAVAIAAEVLGIPVVKCALPWFNRSALSAATRRSLAGTDVLAELKFEINELSEASRDARPVGGEVSTLSQML